MTSQVRDKPNHGRVIFIYFILFFATIVGVNSFFIYSAIHSFPGVITDNPYKKGLVYDEIIEKAKSQPKLQNIVSFENNILRWSLADSNGNHIENADVKVHVVRPLQDGYDFDITMEYIGNGEYEAKPTMPLKGSWTAHLKATWNNTEEFQTSYKLQVD